MTKDTIGKVMVSLSLGALFLTSGRLSGGALNAPSGMFKELNDEILGGALIVRSKHIFIDDYIIEDLTGLEKVLNQPVKHGGNPILGVDDHLNLYGAVLHDKEDNLFKMWYELWYGSGLCYATSANGVRWTKPTVNKKDSNKI